MLDVATDGRASDDPWADPDPSTKGPKCAAYECANDRTFTFQAARIYQRDRVVPHIAVEV